MSVCETKTTFDNYNRFAKRLSNWALNYTESVCEFFPPSLRYSHIFAKFHIVFLQKMTERCSQFSFFLLHLLFSLCMRLHVGIRMCKMSIVWKLLANEFLFPIEHVYSLTIHDVCQLMADGFVFYLLRCYLMLEIIQNVHTAESKHRCSGCTRCVARDGEEKRLRKMRSQR